jgi:hypothetical protein
VRAVVRVSVGHGPVHNLATDQGSCDLYFRSSLETVAEVCTGGIPFMEVFDPLNDDRTTSEGHFSLDRDGVVADEQLVVRFPIDDHPIDVAELVELRLGLSRGPTAIHQPAKQTHSSSLPPGTELESGETSWVVEASHASRNTGRYKAISSSPTTSSTASSTGPGIGRSPKAMSPRSGLGMRLSRARILTARMRWRALVTTLFVHARPAALEVVSDRLVVCFDLVEKLAEVGRDVPSGQSERKEWPQHSAEAGLARAQARAHPRP